MQLRLFAPARPRLARACSCVGCGGLFDPVGFGVHPFLCAPCETRDQAEQGRGQALADYVRDCRAAGLRVLA